MGHSRVTVDCLAFRQPDLATVDALLRLQLMLKRAGEDVVLENCGPRLRELISVVGVQDVLGRPPSVEVGREAEERE